MTDDVPKLMPPEEMPPIDNQASLQRTWRALMGRGGFGCAQLWVMFVDDGGHPLHITIVDEMPSRPEPAEADRLARMLAEIVRDGAVSLAYLFARPGPARRTTDDVAWARELTVASRAVGLTVWPVHVATEGKVSVVAPDDRADTG